MSLQFNDETNYRGLVQVYEKEASYNRGDVSGSTDLLKEFAADSNLALDDLFTIGFKAGGTWQPDDSGHAKYPSISTNLVSGQRDYTFILDEQGNLILDIYRVMVATPSGVFVEISPVDQQTRNSNNTNTDTLINGKNTTGTPTRYDKTANGILLDLIPSYNYTRGLKVFINREPSYFIYSDTTKKAGVPGNLHRYLALKPALDYARRNGLKTYNALAIEVQRYEQLIIPETFGRRERDIPRRLVPNYQNNK